MSKFDQLAALLGLVAKPEEAQAGPVAKVFSELSTLPKDKAAKAFDELLRSGKLENMLTDPLVLRNETGRFNIEKLKEIHPELNIDPADTKSMQGANEFLAREFNTQPAKLVTLDDHINNVFNRERAHRALAKTAKSPISRDQITQELIKDFNKYGGEYAQGTGKSLNLNKVLTQDPDRLASTLLHEFGHETENVAGKNLGNSLYTPETLDRVAALPERLQPSLNEIFVGKRDFSLPENKNYRRESQHIAANLMSDEEFSALNSQLQKYSNERPGDLVTLLENYLTYQASPELRITKPNQFHFMTTPKGLEYETAKAAALEKQNPLEFMKSKTQNSLKKAAAMAPIASMNQPEFENPLDTLKKGYEKYREEVIDPVASQIMSAAEPLIKRTHPSLPQSNAEFNTAADKNLRDTLQSGVAMSIDPINYVEGPVAGGLTTLDFLSSFGKDKNNK